MTYADEAIAEAQRLIEETNARRKHRSAQGDDYHRVRSWYRSGRVTIAVEGFTDTNDKIVWVGRGPSIFDALVRLGEWDAF